MSFKIAAAHQRMMALAYPCELPEQCSAARYYFDAWPSQTIAARVGLTVNIGEE